jgi:putative endonuclease
MAKWSTSWKGREGETAAARYLAARGYRILARNLRLPGGEIDILCVESGELVFVEVKRRDQAAFGSGLGAVDRRKRAILRALAEDYAQIVAPKSRIRFDVVSIDGNRMTVHRNAF